MKRNSKIKVLSQDEIKQRTTLSAKGFSGDSGDSGNNGNTGNSGIQEFKETCYNGKGISCSGIKMTPVPKDIGGAKYLHYLICTSADGETTVSEACDLSNVTSGATNRYDACKGIVVGSSCEWKEPKIGITHSGICTHLDNATHKKACKTNDDTVWPPRD